MIPIISQEEFADKVRKVNPNFEILSEYHGVRKPVLRRCKACGDERYVRACALYSNHGCVVCNARQHAKQRRKSHEQFVAEVALLNPNITILTQYTTGEGIVECKCKIDGTHWATQAKTLASGHGCPECAWRNNKIASHRRTHEEFVREIAEKYPHIRVLSEFKSTSRKVQFACDICGYEWSAVPNTILHFRGVGCPKCAGKAPVGEAEFVERLVHNNPYVTYAGGYTKMEACADFICNKCGHTWSAMASNVLAGKGCSKCKLSRGAKTIANYLNEHDITYEREHRFEDCCDQRPLPFDFYLPDRNTCIEYDGEFHFMPITLRCYTKEEAERKFHLGQLHDKIKDEYCEVNNIKLIRIPYTEFNQIEDILDKQIS